MITNTDIFKGVINYSTVRLLTSATKGSYTVLIERESLLKSMLTHVPVKHVTTCKVE